MKFKLQTLLNCYSYDFLEPKSSGTALKSSVTSADTKTSVVSRHLVKTKKTMALKTPTKRTNTQKNKISPKNDSNISKKAQNKQKVRTSPKLTKNSPKQKVSPKK